jgi:hypothetical protein
MQYSEFKQNEYGCMYRFLESIENREYWQVGDYVFSCDPNAEHRDDCWPLDTKGECLFSKWEEIRNYKIRRNSQLPFIEYKFPCLCRSTSGKNRTVIHHFTFFSIAEILDNSEITGLYVWVDEFRDESKYCSIYAEHGTGYTYCRDYIRKALLNDFSQTNIDKFIKLSKESTPDFMFQFMLDFLNGAVGSSFDYGLDVVEWLRKIGYDTSAIEQANEARALREEQARIEKENNKKIKELAKQEKETLERAQSLITVRDLLTHGEECIFPKISFSRESLVMLIEEYVSKIPLRTKGWIYNNLYSITGEDYKYTGGNSKTFSKLMYMFYDNLKKIKQ